MTKRRLVRRLVLAAAAGLAASPASARPIDMRDYWILAEIVNPTTGERATFRVDCTRGASLHCFGGKDHPRRAHDKLSFRLDDQRRGKDDSGTELNTVWVVTRPPEEGVVGFVIAGAGGFLINDRRLNSLSAPWPNPYGARMDDLRSAKGVGAPMSAIRNGEWITRSDITFRMWLVTPEELAERDAKAKKDKPPEPGAKAGAELVTLKIKSPTHDALDAIAAANSWSIDETVERLIEAFRETKQKAKK